MFNPYKFGASIVFAVRRDLVHISTGSILLLASLTGMWTGSPGPAIASIIATDAYLLVMLWSAALISLRKSNFSPLPDADAAVDLPYRHAALILFAILFFSLAIGFAGIFLGVRGVTNLECPAYAASRTAEQHPNDRDVIPPLLHANAAGGPGSTPASTGLPEQDVDLKDGLDALYFSVVTITTLGYGDFHPCTPKTRIAVLAELLSGMIFLVCALPLLVSRLASID